MRIVYITAGAGGTICGNCLLDNVLASALLKLGHDVILQPIYTPIRTDEIDVSRPDVYLGGVNIYLQAKYPLFRRIPGFLDRALDNPALLRWVSKFAVKTQPRDLGALTYVTVLGEDGPLRKEIHRLAAAVRTMAPDVVHLTNSMLVGLAPVLQREIGVPVFCSFQGEDYYLENLPEPYRTDSFAAMRERASAVDVYVAPCRAQARSLGPKLGLDPESIPVVLPGIALDSFSPRDETRSGEPFTVGYLARIAPEKGLAFLLDAIPAAARLRAAGWVSPEHEPFVRDLERQAAERLPGRYACLRYIERPQKAAFLRAIDALSVPTAYGASKGLYCLEAWACGAPVVQPRIGIFPELIEAGGGGILFEPGDQAGLRTALEQVQDPVRNAELGARGREAVHERFTAERMARQIVELYQTR